MCLTFFYILCIFFKTILSVHGADTVYLNTTCGDACGCRSDEFFPICGSNGLNYHSPCYAGCTESEKAGTVRLSFHIFVIYQTEYSRDQMTNFKQLLQFCIVVHVLCVIFAARPLCKFTPIQKFSINACTKRKLKIIPLLFGFAVIPK